MTSRIIQWNMNGYLNNYNNLLLLINQYSPKIIALQGTQLHSISNIPIPINYNFVYSTNSSTHNSIEHRLITLFLSKPTQIIYNSNIDKLDPFTLTCISLCLTSLKISIKFETFTYILIYNKIILFKDNFPIFTNLIFANYIKEHIITNIYQIMYMQCLESTFLNMYVLSSYYFKQ